MHAVFDVSPNSKYSKDFWRRYDIPNRPVVETARACIGDWVVFRQARFGVYIAIARVDDVVPDLQRPGFSVALISHYLPFASPVPFKRRGRYVEQVLRDVLRPIHIGQLLQGNPIRELWPLDFRNIVLTGFSRTLKINGDEVTIEEEQLGLGEHLVDFQGVEPQPRTIQELLVRRRFRDANFRFEVCGRYGYKCAFTKLCLTDGKHFEVDAAHLRSVREDGPDILQNGLSVMKTLHWALDQHLISVDESYRPLIAPGMPGELLALFPLRGGQLHLPNHQRDWPDVVFLDHHRAKFRKKNRL